MDAALFGFEAKLPDSVTITITDARGHDHAVEAPLMASPGGGVFQLDLVPVVKLIHRLEEAGF